MPRSQESKSALSGVSKTSISVTLPTANQQHYIESVQNHQNQPAPQSQRQ